MDQLDTSVTPLHTDRVSAKHEDRYWEKAHGHGYREMVSMKLMENHEKLEKLIWTMQDALDEVVSETVRQGDCLDEIEDLFESVQQRSNLS